MWMRVGMRGVSHDENIRESDRERETERERERKGHLGRASHMVDVRTRWSMQLNVGHTLTHTHTHTSRH